MSLDITFTLNDSDLEHFRELMQRAVARAESVAEADIKRNTALAIEELENKTLPEFIAVRVAKLRELVQMLDDKDWQLPAEERKAVLSSLAYFCEPADLVPDHIPVLGYMDDAIMIELLVRDLAENFSTYEEFCTFRTAELHRRGAEATVSQEDWLATKRRELHRKLRDNRAARRPGRVFSRFF